jgi:hypothetical protein
MRKALKSPNGPIFQMAELKDWVKEVKGKARLCPAGHTGLEIWWLMRMLLVKVGEPKAAKIKTEYYS